MQRNKFTQYGIFTIVILVSFILLFVGLIYWNTDLYPIYLSLSLVFIVCLLMFYKLDIIIDAESVSFRMGIGLIHKRYLLSNIQSCQSVKNSALLGLGIHSYSKGWLYNVSGSKAIELQFNNKSCVRIGTDKPEEITTIIQSLINQQPTSYINSKTEIKTNKWHWILLLLVIILPFSILFLSNPHFEIVTTHAHLQINGMYPITLSYKDIQKVDTLTSLPPIAYRSNGYSFGGTNIGFFKLSDKTTVRLYVKKAVNPYIYVQIQNNTPIFINLGDSKKNKELYNILINNTQ